MSFFFFFMWGNPHGHLAALLTSGGVVPDLLTKTPRWPTWRLAGLPRDLFRTAAGALLRLLPFWGSHSSGLVWPLRGATPFNAISWAGGLRRQGRPSARDPTRVKSSLCPLLCEHYFFSIGADCEEFLLPSQHFPQLTRGPNSRQSLVTGHVGKPPTPDNTSACAGPCPRALRSGDRCSLPLFQFSVGTCRILHHRKAPASSRRIMGAFHGPSKPPSSGGPRWAAESKISAAWNST